MKKENHRKSGKFYKFYNLISRLIPSFKTFNRNLNLNERKANCMRKTVYLITLVYINKQSGEKETLSELCLKDYLNQCHENSRMKYEFSTGVSLLLRK